MAKNVRDAMTLRPRAIRPEASIQEAAAAMEIEDVGSLPVVDEAGRLVGIVTDRDITLRAVAAGRDPARTPVAEAASSDPLAVGPDDDLDSAMSLMAEHQLRRLPVLEGGALVGMIAVADIARVARDKDVGEVVAVISQRTPGPRVESEVGAAQPDTGRGGPREAGREELV